ncbi:MAG: leucine-rich repeat domain-containing protein [Clostridiales bacterium]|nr:leucine-rich repeat domain-containing protein [Clostridiales bacterium]
MQRFTFQMNYDESSCAVTGYAGDEADVVIPATFGGRPVTILFDKLFRGHAEIRSVAMPDTVTDLGEFLFDGCMALRRIELPRGLKSLWGYTFVRCGLEEVALPDGLTAIPPYAFKDCKSLRRVVCGSGMKHIYAWAFGGCDSLAEVVCAPGVQVSDRAFESNAAIMRIQ